jgi:Protein of unknown function (DUF4239)
VGTSLFWHPSASMVLFSMGSNTVSRQMLRLGAGLAVAACAYGWWHGGDLHAITAEEAEGLNTLILLIGSIYAVIFAFVIYVIWGQFTDVENFMMRECNSLNELLRFSDFLNPDARRGIRRAVAGYVQLVVRSEWPALGERHRDQSTEHAFSQLLDTILRTAPASAEEGVLLQRLIDIGQAAGEHRDERLTKSLTKIPGTLIHLVHTLAIALALLVFFYPFHRSGAGMCCFLLVVVILFLANMVMTDTDNPFKGVYNVNPQPFSDLKT